MGKNIWNEEKETTVKPTRRQNAPKPEEENTENSETKEKQVEASKEQVAIKKTPDKEKETTSVVQEVVEMVETENQVSMKDKILELLPEKDEMVSISLSLSSEAVKLLDEYCDQHKQKRSPVIDVLIKQIFK